MKVAVTKLTLPGGYEILPDPPLIFNQGEPLPVFLSLGKHFVTNIVVEWYEFEEEEEVEEEA